MPDMEAFEAAVTPKTKAVIVNNPNNPSGVVYSEATIKKIAAIMDKKQKEYGTEIYLIADEPYRELVYDGVTVPFLTKYYDNTIVGYSFSKSLSLPGERIGCLYQYDSVSDEMTKIYDCNCYKPIVSGTDNVYYLDVNQNNALVHTNISADKPRTLTTDSIDLYNVYGSYIYYQRYSEDHPALCMIKNDGSDFKELAQGNYSNINVTSNRIYFTKALF